LGGVIVSLAFESWLADETERRTHCRESWPMRMRRYSFCSARSARNVVSREMTALRCLTSVKMPCVSLRCLAFWASRLEYRRVR
jgi:hypothetical protein